MHSYISSTQRVYKPQEDDLSFNENQINDSPIHDDPIHLSGNQLENREASNEEDMDIDEYAQSFFHWFLSLITLVLLFSPLIISNLDIAEISP